MNAKLFSFTGLLLGLFAVASAQEPSAEQRRMEETLRFLQSPKKQLEEEAGEIPYNSSSWNGQGTWMPLRMMVRLGGEAELGLTDEQKQRLPFLYKENELQGEWYQKMRQNPTPEYTQAIEAIRATEIPGDPFFERATEEQKNAYREASMALTNLSLSAMQANVEETLTPEQMLQVRKLEMQLMPAMGIPFPSMFDPLGLTDDQKKEMNKIADELKAEFDQLTQEAATLKAERIVASYGLLKGKSFASQDEFQKALSDVHRQYVPSEAARKKSADLQERGTKLVSTLQTRLMNVFTVAQLDKMQKILDETPKAIKERIAQSKSQQEQQKKSPQYVPSPGSWRPGMPLPIQFKEERKSGRFPRGE
jgi:hypothetical protein